MKVGVVGLGKMGLSHLAMVRAHPLVTEAVVCDSSKYVLDILAQYAGLSTWTDYDEMLAGVELDAVVIATPTRAHAPMVRKALDRGLHVFCEKPFVLDPAEGAELTELAGGKGVVNQVGYHNRFVGAFAEAKRLLDADAIGTVSHALAESYGPVVLRPSGSTWRSDQKEGGGCVYDYAAHPIDLLSWYLGDPTHVSGTVLGHIFSRGVEDEVYSTVHFPGEKSAQLSVNWSDESQRRMTTKLTIWGSGGRMAVDRQELQLFVRPSNTAPKGYSNGWNTRYTTELTAPVWFYVRGEEYSAQLDHFLHRASGTQLAPLNSFASALVTDRLIAQLFDDAAGVRPDAAQVQAAARPARRSRRRRRWSFPRRSAVSS